MSRPSQSLSEVRRQGVATRATFSQNLQPSRLHLNAYNAYQSIIRAATLTDDSERARKGHNMGDRIDCYSLNQDTMDRHLQLLTPRSLYLQRDTIQAWPAADACSFGPLPVSELADNHRIRSTQNTLAWRGPAHDGNRLPPLEEVLTNSSRKRRSGGDRECRVARAGLRLCRRALFGFPESHSQDGESLCDPKRQPSPWPGRSRRRREIHCATR